MPEDPSARVQPYWSLAAGFAIAYFAAGLVVGPLVDLAFGDPIVNPATTRNLLTAILFGLVMGWLLPRLARRK